MAETDPGIPKEGIQAQRIFEQPPDAISFYCELAQVLGTPHEIIMQFYEAVPSPPGPSGSISSIRSRLKATVTFSKQHALNLGKLLIGKAADKDK